MTEIARSKVHGPALGLKITAGLGAAAEVLSIAMNVLGIGIGAAQAGDDGMASMMGGGIGIVFALIGIALSVVVWMAAVKMENLQSYNFALVGAIVAMLPCTPCCIIGLPMGIWAVIVLAKPEVKSAFSAAPI
jgi:hypothetical protein